MYDEFCRQVEKWLDEDPEATIALLSTGFSRGAEQAAGFSRLVHERGIPLPPELIERIRHARGGTGGIELDGREVVLRPVQALGLFDPVGTGVPHNRNRVISGSVGSGIVLGGRDERRNQFPMTQYFQPGLSADGRFAGFILPGAHSDIGGGYHRDGLSTLNLNLMMDFMNAHFEEPILEKAPEPSDPRMYVAHQSEHHLWIYGTSTFERDHARDIVGSQISPPHCRLVQTCPPPDPMDPAVAAMPRHAVSIGPVPVEDHVARWAHDLGVDASFFKPSVLQPDAISMRPSVAQSLPTYGLETARELERSPSIDVHERDHHIDFRAFHQVPHMAERGSYVSGPLHAAITEALRPQYAPDDPRNENHRDHRLYGSLSIQVAELHINEQIYLTDEQLDRVSAALLVEAKREGLKQVTHMEMGMDRDGQRTSNVIAVEAFRGNVDDPRTHFAAVDGAKAIEVPVDTSHQHLQAVNQQSDEVMQQQAMQQRPPGMSMSM